MEAKQLKLLWLTLVLTISIGVQWRWKTANIPSHLLNHPMAFHENFVTEKLGKELLQLVKSVKNFPTNANDLVYYNRTYEHIGEAQKRLPNGECPSSYLIPNKDGTQCVFPGRFDVAFHYMKFGGIDGLKERYEVLASRMQSFGRYIFELDEYPAMKEIFTSEKFLKDAKEVCPENKQILDPFQYHLIIQVPGQVVPVHLDAPLFTDASRFQYPVWLLVAMTGSGLYKEKFIDQIQVVINLHEWNNTKQGGQFAYYPNNTVKPVFVQPLPRSATIMDGAKTIHATNLYKPKVQPPSLPKNAFNVLEYIGDDIWIVKSDEKEIASYKTDDLRITVVYRAKCFESEEKRDTYNQWYQTAPKDQVRPVSEIVDELKEELAKRRGVEIDTLDALTPVELATNFIEEFIPYPYPVKSVIPYNYCIFIRLYPESEKYLRYIC